jgi:hypothetical protein
MAGFGGEVFMARWMILMWMWLSGGLPGLAWAATDLDGWRIVQISTADRLAVAKSPEGALRLVRVGDRLGEHVTVTGFDGERIILEEPGKWGRVTLYVRVVYGRQRVERRERQPLRKSEVAGGPADIVVVPVAGAE